MLKLQTSHSIFQFVLLALFTSCSSLIETIDPNDENSPPYTLTTNEKGEETYKRTIIKKSIAIEDAKISESSNETKSLIPITKKAIIDKKQPVDIKKKEEENLRHEQDEKKKESKYKSFGFLEFSKGDGFVHLGVSGGYNLKVIPLGFRVGFSFFDTDRRLYAGLDLGTRLRMVINKLEPFIGAGSYIGDHKRCEDKEDSIGNKTEKCEKNFLFATYIEYGIKFEKLAVIGREYSINESGDSIPAKSFFGINIYF